MPVATILLWCVAIYFALGAAFAAAFVIWGAARIDHAAQGMPIQARIMIAPASAALWPFLALRWARVENGERRP